MTWRRIWRAAMALPATILLLAPAGSLAARTYVYRGGFETYATVRGAHGFRVDLAETSRGGLRVIVAGHHSRTTYRASVGAPSPDRVAGSLGRLGRFDLRFVPVGKSRAVPIVNWCTGPKGAFQAGYLVGRFRFRGERDYTRVQGHRVPAAVNSWSALRCRYATSEPFHPGREPRAHLSIWTRGRRQRLDFGTVVFHRHARPDDRRVQFWASTSGRAGRVSISREVKVTAPESTVAFPGGPKLPEELKVTPPAPFTGSAIFARTSESTFTWTGDLAVDFPGLAPLRLSGARFGARMCALLACVAQEPETE
ncbi:MAG TPA: hypothetical protein VHZ54_06875 [Solirubrobacterales bacterium]|jgi:hypothetical protein|nr:hypothetical protein [Solirubrobacterales bacterium]